MEYEPSDSAQRIEVETEQVSEDNSLQGLSVAQAKAILPLIKEPFGFMVMRFMTNPPRVCAIDVVERPEGVKLTARNRKVLFVIGGTTEELDALLVEYPDRVISR